MNAAIATGALLIDRLFGEFLQRSHPVVLIGRFISAFEQRLYADSFGRGVLLWLATLTIALTAAFLTVWMVQMLPGWLAFLLTTALASTLLAHRMLYDAVNTVLHSPQPQESVTMLVSRDTQSMSHADAYKAAIETYAENLSDGVIAPLFFLLLFGLPGIVFYKAVNTLDSMVGYRTERYEKFGKFSARIDDLANWIPARISAVLIMLLNRKWRFWSFYTNGRQHKSPNAGHPITAMALSCRCRLGGPTAYFGKLEEKAYFGRPHDNPVITPEHLQCALQRRNAIDLTLISVCVALGALCYHL
ncbi:cobalamin biosynthesis protein CobD [Thiomicrorhabdus xiamenensis]|uniref:Cobalamin biosynthesis protein CobD n=2 Tax=Thiomicrorhabdus xiamenensis TaxID=2739063 RepID=A0A7D4P698_9GAMM|nr:cobalamin biosynthesis protein CobD [Thiomicrorhabdus xiamenensis]